MKNTVTLLLPILFPMLCGVLVGLLPALKDESRRRTFVLSSLVLTFLFTLWQLLLKDASLYLFTLAPKAEIAFSADTVTRFFAGLIAFMWLPPRRAFR